MTVALLDINILLALHDHGHAQHEIAIAWFEHSRGNGWATCPITESGFIRIASNPRYPGLQGDPGDFARILAQTCDTELHLSWAADLSVLDVLTPEVRITSSQITDIYLLALAIAHGSKLATFDRRIPAHLLPAGKDALEVIPS